MSNDILSLKVKVEKEIDMLCDEMTGIARTIHAKPEIGYQEFESSKILTSFLKKYGFEVNRNIADMETAFLGSYTSNPDGPTVALLAEYDALPGMGHGCAHNLIGTAAAGAAIGLSRALPDLKGRVLVIGCPAEEAGIDGAGGKVHLIDKAYFKGIDAALIFHPSPATTVGGETNALIGLEFDFKGKSAHSAGNPWDGINALDGVIHTFNSINALRQHLRDDVRIHGIITHGGDAPNIVPEHASSRFFVRSASSEYLKEVVEKVKNCAQGAALATGAHLTINHFCNFYDSMQTNSFLAEIIEKNLNSFGLKVDGRKKGKGSTDFGNVTRCVPACELAIRLGNGIVPHTNEFVNASNSEEGYRVMMLGAKIMALSTVDLLYNPALLEQVKEKFKCIQQ